MRKIKEDGPFAGKNVLIFDSQGKPQPKSTVVKNDSKNFFESLRKNQIQGEDVLMLQSNDELNQNQIEHLEKVR